MHTNLYFVEQGMIMIATRSQTFLSEADVTDG